MDDRLSAACGAFEQQVISGFLRPTTGTKAADDAPTTDDDDASGRDETADAFSQLVTQALAGAIERAGGIGLRASLVHALDHDRGTVR